MLQIDNHSDKALEAIIPYLHQIPELVGIAQNSGNRAQQIEDIAWELLWNLDVDTAQGVWLDYLGRKVGQVRVYSPVIEGAFTFGGSTDEGFGSGEFASSALSGDSTAISRNDDNFRKAIKEKIIENNTDCSLDELIQACKLLYNASIVNIQESYPAGISSINLWGSSLLESANANLEVKRMLPAGVSLDEINFYNSYNLFLNDAFISYLSYDSQYLIPETDDFTFTFDFFPTQVNSTNIPLISESSSFSSDYSNLKIYYNDTDGVVFAMSPDVYNIGDNNSLYYSNGSSTYYNGSGSLVMSGGSVLEGESNSVKIVRVHSTGYSDYNGDNYTDGLLNSYSDNNTFKYSLYLNDVLVDEVYSNTHILDNSGLSMFVGVAENIFFNSGSIFNLYLKNDTTNSVILNDNLRSSSNTGSNNGVLFI